MEANSSRKIKRSNEKELKKQNTFLIVRPSLLNLRFFMNK